MKSWWTFMSRVIFSRFFLFCQGGGDREGASYIFVVNVNVNDDGLDVNVNRFENGNVWSGEYRHRVVSPQLYGFLPCLFRGSFYFQSFFPASDHTSDFIQLSGEISIFIVW